MKAEIEIGHAKIVARCEGAWLRAERKSAVPFNWEFTYTPEHLATAECNLLLAIVPHLIETAELLVSQGIEAGRIDPAKAALSMRHRVFVACDHAVARKKIDHDLLALALAHGIEPVAQEEDCFIPVGRGIACLQTVFPKRYPDFVACGPEVLQNEVDHLARGNVGANLFASVAKESAPQRMEPQSLQGVEALFVRAKVWAHRTAARLCQLALSRHTPNALSHPERDGDQNRKKGGDNLHAAHLAAAVSAQQSGKDGAL